MQLEPTVVQRIRDIFLHREPTVSIDVAAKLLGRTPEELTRAIESGELEMVVDPAATSIPRTELIAATLESWSADVIEKALGQDAASVLPKSRRLVDFRARLPRYHVAILRYLARREGMTPAQIIARELEGIASASSEEFAATIPGFADAFAWPDPPGRWLV